MQTPLTVTFEFLGGSHFAGYVADLLEVPPVIGQGVTQTRQRLEQQLQIYFATNFAGQTFSIVRTRLLFASKNWSHTAASRLA